MVTIIQKEGAVLRRPAKEILPEEITNAPIQKIIADMKEALASQEDGVAIAAPQIGESLRIFVVSGNVLAKATREKNEAHKTDEPDLVFINPVITKLSKSKKMMSEGCLSMRYLYGDVLRSTKATLKAYNERGEPVLRGASGLLAQVFQHETDHLEGILFTDKAENIENLPPQNA